MSRLALTLAAALALTAPTTAIAQQGRPPAPCGAPAVVDPADDGGAPNEEITAIFARDEDGEVSLNVRVANLSRALPAGALNLRWDVFFESNGAPYRLRAFLRPGGNIVYEYARGTTTLGTTTGTFFEGKDGVIKIVVPPLLRPIEDGPFLRLYAQVIEGYGEPAVANPGLIADSAPDVAATSDASSPSNPCAMAAARPPAPAPMQPPPPPAAAPAPSTDLPVFVDPRGGSARRAVRSRALALRLNAKRPVADLRIGIFRGGKRILSFAQPTLFEGRSTLRVALRGRRLAAGSYLVTLSGNIDGRRLTTNRRLRLIR